VIDKTYIINKEGGLNLKKITEKVNDPSYITIHTSERFNKPVGRVISKKLLRKIITERCEIFKQGKCNECFTDKQELETGCLDAWQLTIGKGKKLY
jgi:hypothetical protein